MARSTNYDDSSATVPTITVSIPVPTITVSIPVPKDDNSDAQSFRSLPPEYVPPASPPEVHVAERSTNLLPNEEPPAYSNVVVDMPPSYKLTAEQDPQCVMNEEQKPWTLTKKLYICGFLFWPLWFVGAGFSVFGRTPETRQWGRRCVWNSLVVIAIFAYLVIAYVRTDGNGVK